MKNAILLILISFLSYQSFAQESVADSLRNVGLLEEAIEQFALQYAESPENNDNTYNYACALALVREIDSAFHYLTISLEGDSTSFVLNDPDFYFLLQDPRWSELEDEMIKRIEASSFKYKNHELVKELWRMRIKDQAFYYHTNVFDNKLFSSSIWELKRKLNKENLSRLEEIIEEYGWPKQSEVGGWAAGTAFFIVQHSDFETQKKYLPLMTEAANNGEARWSLLALLIDRINMGDGKPQIYGSQIQANDEGVYEVYEIENPQYVNQRRAEVGLGPIEEYVKYWDIEWTIEQLSE